jgi:3'(2'), 5'-bisphosphate nucleotidase
LRVVASKSHLSPETQAFIDSLAKRTKRIEQVSKGSSLKLVMVAEGSADVYPRLAPTMEWDTAAADAIVRETGRMTYRYEEGVDYLGAGREALAEFVLPYNKENLLNSWFVVL